MEAARVCEGLQRFISRNFGGAEVRVENAVRLTGGASRETWSFDADIGAGAAAQRLEGILRMDTEGGSGVSPMPGRELEFESFRAAWEAGVVVPEPLWDGDKTFGSRFFVMRRVAGETLGGRLIRGDQSARARSELPTQLAQSLARIHQLTPAAAPALAGLPSPAAGASPARTEVENFERSYRQASPDPHPTFELAFRWLYAHLPPAMDRVLVHGDFRLGNFIFGEEGLRGILDWELAHWGDPMEDLGLFAVRSWRFGGRQAVAGIGARGDFYRAYEAAGGWPVDEERVRFWELFGNLRWGIITITQAAAYLSGRSRSVELASIGRRTAETEWELLNLLPGKAD